MFIIFPKILLKFNYFTLSPISETKIDENDDMKALYLDSCFL